MIEKSSLLFKLRRLFGFALIFFIAVFNFSDEMYAIRKLPEAVFIASDGSNDLPLSLYESMSEGRGGAVAVSAEMNETLEMRSIDIRLFGFISLARVRIYDGERENLLPGGNAIGISIHTDGVLIVGFGDIVDRNGRSTCPAKSAGLREGDVIIGVNGSEVCDTDELRLALELDSELSSLRIKREDKEFTAEFAPVTDKNGNVHIGVWARDSTIGIGTLSFISERDHRTAALGHAVVDPDTGSLLPVFDGTMVHSSLLGVTKGRSGSPGELRGTFSKKSPAIGPIYENTDFGVFGECFDEALSNIERFGGGEFIPVAFPNEVREGDAHIYAQVDSSGVEAYECRILRAAKQNKPSQKGLVIKITDERLLDKTGGIVQGMSGSPIIQDGRLVGVVTHVFVNDPEKGYGIYAYWMQELLSELP